MSAVTEVVRSVWNSLLDLDASPDDRGPAEDSAPIASQVRVRGGWDGRIRLTCDTKMATRIAGIMFGVPAAECTDVQIQDAVGELASILSGNIKGLADTPCTMSMPIPVEPTDDPCSRSQATTIAFACGPDRFQITLYANAGAAQPGATETT